MMRPRAEVPAPAAWRSVPSRAALSWLIAAHVAACGGAGLEAPTVPPRPLARPAAPDLPRVGIIVPAVPAPTNDYIPPADHTVPPEIVGHAASATCRRPECGAPARARRNRPTAPAAAARAPRTSAPRPESVPVAIPPAQFFDRVFFAEGSTSLPANDMLDAFAQLALDTPDAVLILVAYADAHEQSSEVLSELRVNAAANYLVRRGVPRDRIKTYWVPASASFDTSGPRRYVELGVLESTAEGGR